MFRLLIFLAALALAAWGLSWLASNPGDVTVTWRGVGISGLADAGARRRRGVCGRAVDRMGPFALRFSHPLAGVAHRSGAQAREGISRADPRYDRGRRRGRPGRGQARVRGGPAHRPRADDQAPARPSRRSSQATPRAPSRRTTQMLDHHETHGLGLRGLHLEARRADDHEAALQYAMRANARAPAAWAGQAVLDDRTRRGDWAGALATVDTNAAARLIDKPTANRWRAVIKTAMAEAAMERDPKHALALAQEACRLAPGARAGGRHLRPADRASGRLSPRKPHSRGGLRADAPSRSRRRLPAGPPRRFGRRPAGARSCARPGRAGRSRIAR